MNTNSLFLESEDDLFEISSASSIGGNAAIKIILTLFMVNNYRKFLLSRRCSNSSLWASKKYRITSLHPFQLEAAENAIFGHNTLVIQPTGKGKSLCYQLVALQMKQQVLVFTPTIALMQDQVKQLQSKDIPAMYSVITGNQWKIFYCTITNLSLLT